MKSSLPLPFRGERFPATQVAPPPAFALPLLCALALGGSNVAAAADPVELSLTGVQVESVSLTETHLVLETAITRTRWPPVRLRGIEHVLRLNQKEITTGEASFSGVRLCRTQSATVEIPVTFHTAEAVGRLASGALQGRLDLQLEGQVKVGIFLLPVRIPFESQVADVDLSALQGLWLP